MRILMCLVILMTAVQGWARERELVPVLSLDGYVVYEHDVATHDGGICEFSSATRFHDRRGWVGDLHRADFCYVGRVDTLTAECIVSDRGTQYLGLVRCRILKPYWGTEAPHHIGEMHLRNDGRCIRYGTPYPWPPAKGDTLFVTGRIDEDGRARIFDLHLLKRVNGFLGAWRIDGDDLLTRHGLRVGSYAEALAHAATLNKPHRPRHHPHPAPEG